MHIFHIFIQYIYLYIYIYARKYLYRVMAKRFRGIRRIGTRKRAAKAARGINFRVPSN